MRCSEACERNKEPILQVLRQWLPAGARVLEVGSGTGQHAVFFAGELAGVRWQPSDRAEHLEDLRARIAEARNAGRRYATPERGVAGTASDSTPPDVDPPRLSWPAEPFELDVDRPEQWPAGPFEAVFSANTTHIMAAESVPRLLAGAARLLTAGGLLLLYGPFHEAGRPTAESNAAFDAHLRSLDPHMGVRDARALREQASGLGLDSLADVAMPANNRMLIFRRRP